MKKKAVKRSAPKKPNKDAEALAALTVEFVTPEFVHHAKNELWYIGIGLLLLVGIILALGAANYLLAVVVIAAGLAIFRMARERPEPRKVTINPFGVRWGNEMFGYHQFKAFWASETSGQLAVYLERPNFGSVIHITVPVAAADQVLTFLSLELPFHWHRDEPISDRLSRLLKI